jgi:hypothetical protein
MWVIDTISPVEIILASIFLLNYMVLRTDLRIKAILVKVKEDTVLRQHNV